MSALMTPVVPVHSPFQERLRKRRRLLEATGEETFDVVVVGGGVSGASVFRELSCAGYRTLLLEKGDFAGATSQASAMMIWGGLLYLRHWDVATVRRLSAARDRMIDHETGPVRSRRFVYLSRKQGGTHPGLALLALYFYWGLGGFRRGRPGHLKEPLEELSFLRGEHFHAPLGYEEAVVTPSDSRLVLQRILDPRGSRSSCFNHCRLVGGAREPEGGWNLEIQDDLLGLRRLVRCRWVVNAAGVWVDPLNGQMGIRSPWRHLPSKGVFLGLRRLPGHRHPLIIDTGQSGTCLALLPWGPLSLWGPTETTTSTQEGFRVEPDDVRFLLRELRRHLRIPVKASDIVSLRCGVRPLPLPVSSPPPATPIELSRRHVLYTDREACWSSVYGGKLTGAGELAGDVLREIASALPAPGDDFTPPPPSPVPTVRFPALAEEVPDPGWCAEREMCWSLEDYLRRRTNIAQWVPRGGLGRRDENREHLVSLARHFYAGEDEARQAVDDYRSRVEETFDHVLSEVKKGESR